MSHASASLVCTALALALAGCSGSAETDPDVARRAQAVESAPPHLVEVAAGRLGWSCARLSDGTARCFGRNAEGQLGIGPPAVPLRLLPTPVLSLTGVAGIAAGRAHGCAALEDGTARCWGLNITGQIGDGTFLSRPAPVVVAGLAGVRAVAAGGLHSCALLLDGTARCWGDASFGQLGDGIVDGIGRPSPVTVAGIGTVTAIAAGDTHSCALLSGGTVRCWGRNASGQIGDGTISSTRLQPTAALGLTDAVAVATGNDFTCAVRAGGTVWCWGRNDGGQLGIGTQSFTPEPVPRQVLGLGGADGAVAVAAGDRSACAVLTGGRLRCWGDNPSGQLGDGTKVGRPSPVPVALPGPAAAAAVGSSHACAVLEGGCAVCFGQNAFGQLGDGTQTDRPSPAAVAGFPCGFGLGQACTAAGACLSGFCVDGVCCDSACAGACAACSLAGGGPQNGTCSPVPGGAMCRPIAGPCDAAEVCSGAELDCPPDRRQPAGILCRGAAGACDLPEICDGIAAACPADGLVLAGALCRPAVGACDAPEVCDGQAPACPADGFAPAGAPCRGASCTAGVATAAAACDGAGACPGAVTRACGAFLCGEGACRTDCQGDGDCAEDHRCEAAICVPKGGPATACGAGRECLSGFCADGVCCDGACDGQCAACDLPGSEGTCAAVRGAPRGGRPACAGDGTTCGGACDGAHLAACGYPGAAVSCRAPSCDPGTAIATAAASCDGQGRCPQEVLPCAPYTCGPAACRASCAAAADCLVGLLCEEERCVADVTPPTVTLAVPAVWGHAELVVRGSAEDAGGLRGVVLLLDGVEVGGPLAVAADGTVHAPVVLTGPVSEVLLKATDRAGNVAAALGRVRLDQAPPEITVRAPAQGQALGDPQVAVSLEVRDESEVEVEVAGQRFPVPAGGGLVATTVTLAEAGPGRIAVRARDAAGNEATREALVLVDFGAPLLSIDLVDGAIVGPQPDGLYPYTLRIDSLSAVTVEIGGTAYALPRGGGVIQEVLALREGRNDLRVRATSELGRQAALLRTLTYDVTGPEAAFVVPAAGAFLRGAFDLVVEARDALSGVAAVSFRIDGGAAVAAAAEGSIFSAPARARGALGDGPHQAELIARDGAGNERRGTVGFTVDDTAPQVAFEAPAEGAALRGAVTVRAQASDGGSGVARVALFAGERPLGACAAALCALALDAAALPAGPLVLRAVATDRAGNTGTAQRLVAVGDEAPARFLTSPAPGAVVSGLLTVAVAITDPDFVSVECRAAGRSLGRSTDRRFHARLDTRLELDGPLEVRCEARDRAGHTAADGATVTVRNWRLELRPGQLSLRCPGGRFASLRIRGDSAALLLPIAGRKLALAVAGGSPVPALFSIPSLVRDEDDDDDDHDLRRIVLKFDRRALLRSIEAGIAAGAIRPDRPVTVRLLAGNRELGSDTIRVGH